MLSGRNPRQRFELNGPTLISHLAKDWMQHFPQFQFLISARMDKYSRHWSPGARPGATQANFGLALCHFQACSTLVHSSRLGVTCLGQRTHERRVHCNLSSLEKRQPIHHHLKPPGVALVDHAQVQISNKNVSHLLHGRFLPLQFPKETLCARELLPQHTPTGGGQRHRRRNNTFRTCGSKRVARLVGKLTNGAEAKGPPCDFKRAMSGSDRVGNTTFKKDDSTARDATACHPTLGWFGSSSTRAGASSVDRNNSSQLGGVNPVATQRCWAPDCDPQQLKDGLCHLWVAFVNHLDGVRHGATSSHSSTPDLLLRVAKTSLLSNWGMVPLMQLRQWCKNNAKSVHHASTRTPRSIQATTMRIGGL